MYFWILSRWILESDLVCCQGSYLRKARALYLPTPHHSTADGKVHRCPRAEGVAQAPGVWVCTWSLCKGRYKVTFVGREAATLAKVMALD